MITDWPVFWLILPLMMAATTLQIIQKRRQMGPRIYITEQEFLKLAEKERGLVIRGPITRWFGTIYLLRSGDYYYYTQTKIPLSLPKECQICDSKNILL